MSPYRPYKEVYGNGTQMPTMPNSGSPPPDESTQDLRELIQGTESLIYGEMHQHVSGNANPGVVQSRFQGQWNQQKPYDRNNKPYGSGTGTGTGTWANNGYKRQNRGNRYNPNTPMFPQPNGPYMGTYTELPATVNYNSPVYPQNQHYYSQPQQWFQNQQTQSRPYAYPSGNCTWTEPPQNEVPYTSPPQPYYPQPPQHDNYTNLQTQYVPNTNQYGTPFNYNNQYCNGNGVTSPNSNPLLLPQIGGPLLPSYAPTPPRPPSLEFYHFEPPSGRHTSLEKLLEQHLQLMNDACFTPAMDLQLVSRYGPYDTCSTFINRPKTRASQRSSGVSSISAKTASTSVSPPNGSQNQRFSSQSAKPTVKPLKLDEATSS